MKNKIFVFAVLVLGLYGLVHAVSFTAPQISSGTSEGIAIAETVTVFPRRYMECLNTIVFTNVSTSETIFMSSMETAQPTAAVLRSSGTPIYPQQRFIVDIDPLQQRSTFYFVGESGTTGVNIRAMQLGCPGDYR